MPSLNVKLNSIYCHVTEDDTGADEFYVIALMANGSGKPKAVFKGIWSLNDGQSVTPNDDLFTEAVSPGDEVMVHLYCFDQDAAGSLDDASLDEAIGRAYEAGREINAYRETRGMEPLPWINVAIMIARILWDIIRALVDLDRDDFLGEDEFTLTVPPPVAGAGGQLVYMFPYNNPIPRPFKCLYDGAHYDVVYTVTLRP